MFDAKVVSVSYNGLNVSGWILADNPDLQYDVVAVGTNGQLGKAVTENSKAVSRRGRQLWKKVFTIRLVRPAHLNELQLFAFDGTARWSIDLSDSLKGQSREYTSAKNEFSQVLTKVGQTSECENAVIGRSGYFFLIGGSNDVLSAYKAQRESESLRWAQLIEQRLNSLTSKGLKFCQVVIPEKSSLIPEFFPYQVVVPSLRYRSLKSLVTGDYGSRLAKHCVFYEDCVSNDVRFEVFRKVDSHFTSLGAKILFLEIMRNLGLDICFDVVSKEVKFITGDLANKFKNFRFLERVDYFSEIKIEGEISDPEMVYSFDSEDGNKGKIRIYKNSSAMIKKKVLVFGNSFFWSGGRSMGQCWWLSRVFSECHFIWDYNIRYDYLERNPADIVISVTIERFLGMVPES